MKNCTLFVFLIILFVWIDTNAQINVSGEPISFVLEESLKSDISFEVMPAVDVESLIAEDKVNDLYKDIPWRFGFEFEVNYNLENSGVWNDFPKGDKIWRLGIKSEGAVTINLIFNNYHLPSGAKLFVYSADKSEIIGAFTEFNNQEDRYFATTLIRSDDIIIEYYEPYNAAFPGELSLETVTHGYRDAYSYAKAFGGSGSCNINVACPEAAGWGNEIRSVTHLITGAYVCTGALINNAENNGTPYYLSADHCYSNPGALVFWFNWESPTCSNPASSPPYSSMSGSVLRARNSASDFWLVELNSIPPVGYNAFYAGWNRVNAAGSSSVAIHHPSGDIKKISFDYNSYSSDYYLGNSGVANSHWKITDWDLGTTEGGSSGSPLFDPNHRIVGQLHGGYAACGNNSADWYGKFSTSWDYGSTAATRLSDWLDPNSIGITAIDGYDPNAPTELTANFSGNPTTVVVGNTVTFSNLSNGPNPITSYSWSFPGGTPSSANTAGPHSVTYNTLGTYNVSLTVGDGTDTNTETKLNYITVSNCSYCTSNGNMTYLTSTTLVNFNTINNVTAKPAAYNNYTAQSTGVTQGNAYNLTINVNTDGNYTVHTFAWIDWNQNCDFTDAGEVYDLGTAVNVANGPTSASPYSITVPAGATLGSTRMRISTKYNSDPGSCETGFDGEVEDYTVNVMGNIILDLKVYLEGPFNGTNMNSDIVPYLPLSQPFNMPPWNYSGTESVGSIPNPNVVDWVLIDVRDAVSAAIASSGTSVAKQAAFILNDGSIVDLDGSSNLQFDISISQNMYIVVWQRNHLGIISNNALPSSDGIYTYDFTTGENQVYGGPNGHKLLTSGVWGMFGGDGNRDWQVDSNDKVNTWETEAGENGYLFGDYNLDGESDNQDKDDIWVPNEGKSSQVPN